MTGQGERNARRARRARRRKLAGATELKRQTFYALENISRGRLLAKVVGVALFVLIVTNAVVVFVSAQPGLDPVAAWIIARFYAFSTVCFLVEYLARIWIADLAFTDVPPWRARLRYVLSPLGIIDLLSFLPTMMAWFVPLSPQIRASVNVLRLIRLIKISRYMRGLRTIGRVLGKHRHEIVASFLVIALLVVVSSILMYEIESPVQPDAFNSLLSGLYWAVETVTGTGYGDIVPVTVPGRMVGSLIMFLSVALVAIPGGIFSAGFVAEFQNASLRRLERDERRGADHAGAKGPARVAEESPEGGAQAVSSGEEGGGAGVDDGSRRAEGIEVQNGEATVPSDTGKGARLDAGSIAGPGDDESAGPGGGKVDAGEEPHLAGKAAPSDAEDAVSSRADTDAEADDVKTEAPGGGEAD